MAQLGELYGQSALKLDPMSPRALGVVGDALAALSRSDEARSAWLAAEKKTTASPRELALIARRNMALAQRVERLQDFSLAERFYRRVLLLQPEHVGATKGIARCLVRLGDHAEAQTWAHKAEMLELRKKRLRL
jgi:tetratricopeptide (TPR) repeat protein